MIDLPAVGERFNDGRGHVRCCEEDWGGSHYHCGGGCGAVTSMYGHYGTVLSEREVRTSFLRDSPHQRLALPRGWRGHWCEPLRQLLEWMGGRS